MNTTLIFTVTTTERFTPVGYLDAVTIANLKMEGFKWERGSWYKTSTIWKQTDEETLITKNTRV